MTAPFVAAADRIEVRLTGPERAVLRAIPVLLAGASTDEGDPEWARMRSLAHPDHPERAARFRELTAEMLDQARAADRDLLAAGADAASIGFEEAEAWLRVIGEARLLLAARLGIEEEGWLEQTDRDGPIELDVLRLLGYLQEELVETLSRGL